VLLGKGESELSRIAPPLIEALESRQLLSTYYVSASGHDSKSGNSPHNAWKSIDRLNRQVLRAGDLVLFQGGKTFGGSIYVPSAEGGTASKSVVFSSYGSGRATISSGTRAGIDIAQTGGVAVTNLNFTGGKGNSWPGVWIHTDRANKRLSNIHIKNVEVKNYGREGIKISIDGNKSSLSNVKIERASLHDNVYGGLKATAQAHNANKNWMVDRVRAFNNPGSKSAGGAVTGSGIFVADVEDAVIQNCVAFNNGQNGSAPVGHLDRRLQPRRVPVQRVVQQQDAHDQRRRRVRLRLGHAQLGHAVQLQPRQRRPGLPHLCRLARRERQRHPLQHLRGRRPQERQGGDSARRQRHQHRRAQQRRLHDAQRRLAIRGVRRARLGQQRQGAQEHPRAEQHLQTTGGVKVVALTGNVAKNGTFRFNANAYYSSGKPFKIQWGDRAYTSLTPGAGGKGQEKYSGVATGFQGDPRLKAPGHGGTIGNPDKLRSKLGAYQLARTSPVINKGVPRLAFLSARVKQPFDFFGRKGLRNGKYDIGVNEVK
jgi:hypothetical protein